MIALAALTVSALVLVLAADTQTAPDVYDQVCRNGDIHTIDKFPSEALAIKGGKLIKIVSEKNMKSLSGKATKVIKLRA